MTRVTATCLFLFAAVGTAQEPTPPLPASHFAGRRAALAERIRAAAEDGERHVVVLRGAAAAADMATFYQDHDFYYLTGVREPGAAMWMTPADDGEELMVPPFSRFTAQWEGDRLKPGDEAAVRTGFAKVGNARSLKRRLDELLAAPAEGDATRVVLWTWTKPQPNRTGSPSSAAGAAQRQARDRLDGRPTREQAFVDAMQGAYPHAEVRDLTPLVGELRAIKTQDEIERIRAASRIAALGIAEAMRSTEPGVYEFQIAAAARYVFSRYGAGPDAYAAIVGAGKNGCVLHYSACSAKTVADDLIVMDYGPTVHGYCTDVTRTFPANGEFSPEQRKLVEDVHAVQQALLAEAKPGARLSTLGALCSRLLRDRGYRSMHGPCHHVGLAVHDKQGDVLQPGMVITVEPGAYLLDNGMGCRIEDTILITEDGYENLSADVPSSPDAIEALMRGEGVQQRAVGGDVR